MIKIESFIRNGKDMDNNETEDEWNDQIRYNEKGEPVISVMGLINYTAVISLMVSVVAIGVIEIGYLIISSSVIKN